MPKVLFVISGLGAGGAERVISQIASHWHGKGIDVGIASFDTLDDPEFHHFGSGISRYRLGQTNTGKNARAQSKLRDLVALRALLKNIRPDVVISFLTKNNLLALIAASGTQIPVVCCERNNPDRQEKHPAWNRMLSIAYRRAKLIVCQTEAVKSCFQQSVKDRLRVIPNPIKAWPFVRKAVCAQRIVAVGRLTEQKGFDLLIDAFAGIEHADPDWQLEIFGEGPQRGALQQTITRLKLSKRVHIMGNSPEPGSWIQNADLFVLSSRYEGFPNVLGEAMAAGLPVIATNCKFGPEEMVDHMHSGLLVPSEDPGALADAMLTCMKDEPLRKKLGANAVDSIAAFAPPQVMQQWDNLLGEALSIANDQVRSESRNLREPAG